LKVIFVLKTQQLTRIILKSFAPSANILVRGSTGLVSEEIDQRVTVIPDVSATLPLAGAAVAGALRVLRLFGSDKKYLVISLTGSRHLIIPSRAIGIIL